MGGVTHPATLRDWLDEFLSSQVPPGYTYPCPTQRSVGPLTRAELAPWSLPKWDAYTAFTALDIKPFPNGHRQVNDSCAGGVGRISNGDYGLWLNPHAADHMKGRVCAHELAHVVLGHVDGDGPDLPPTDPLQRCREMEVEAVAALVARAGGAGQQSWYASVYYYRDHRIGQPWDAPITPDMPSHVKERVVAAASKILTAGWREALPVAA